MIHLGYHDCVFISHVAEVVQDRIYDGNGYTSEDERACEKLEQIGRSGGVVLTGDELSEDEATALLRRVVLAELENWIPNASQRLIRRAVLALGGHMTEAVAKDHGGRRINHVLIPDWVAGIYLMRCVTCHRLFQH
jgi:hypothetical protein